MSIWSIIGKEIRYNRANFVIGLVCIAVALGIVVGAITLLSAHDIKTEQLVQAKERETRQAMTELEDDYRLMMRDMGHNVLVLNEEQSIEELRMRGAPDTYMPEEYVFELSTGGIENVNHLFPVLQERATWPEKEREVIFAGTMGQVPNFEKPRFLDDEGRYRNPIRETLPEGAIEVGHAIAETEGLSVGDTVTVFDEEFAVHRVHSRKGNEDDVTVWAGLDKVQEWFDREGQINGILALECVCDFEQFGTVEEEVQQILPDTQVMEFGTILRARYEARARADELHQNAVQQEQEYREQLGAQRAGLVRIMVPVVLLGAAVWIFFLILNNVKERQGEIAIMRTVGLGQGKIMGIFLVKAALMGIAGALVGYLAGIIGGAAWEGIPIWQADFGRLISPALAGLVLVGAPLLTIVAGWIPAMKAAQVDPAVILREE
ncbi:MAG: FtsX-like permease family protein [Candidatus Hydrogenedentota bacterium]